MAAVDASRAHTDSPAMRAIDYRAEPLLDGLLAGTSYLHHFVIVALIIRLCVAMRAIALWDAEREQMKSQ
jgi:hypothetical protein